MLVVEKGLLRPGDTATWFMMQYGRLPFSHTRLARMPSSVEAHVRVWISWQRSCPETAVSRKLVRSLQWGRDLDRSAGGHRSPYCEHASHRQRVWMGAVADYQDHGRETGYVTRVDLQCPDMRNGNQVADQCTISEGKQPFKRVPSRQCRVWLPREQRHARV